MRAVFLGTPKFAADVLKILHASEHQVLAVVTQPDRPNKRGNRVEPSETKKLALELGLPVYQYEKISKEGIDDLTAMAPDVLVTAAYGQILSEEVLRLAPYGVINVHASLLPKYRGSSPVQWALFNGETEVGVTVMKTALRVDSGEMYQKVAVSLNGEENTEEVLNLLAPVGAKALVEVLSGLEQGVMLPEPQCEADATHYPMLKKEDGRLDFNLPAVAIKNKIRAFTPWPSAFCHTSSGVLKVFRAVVIDDGSSGVCGKIVAIDTKNGITVQAANGKIIFTEVQPEGGKKMSAVSYGLGRKVSVGEVLQ